MIRKIALILLALFLLVLIISPSLVWAQNELRILDSSVEVNFPLRLNFNLSAQSSVNITDVRLCYTVERASFAQIVSEGYVEFTPAKRVDVSWLLETVKFGGLPPGATLTYWWRVSDSGGSRVETAPALVSFEDTRYLWRSLSEGLVNLYWYKGDEGFARELMFAAQGALERLAGDTGASLEKPVRLYIYSSADDLKGAMVHPQEWTGGVAYTQYGIMAIGISPSQISWGKRTIAHELTHLVIGQMTFNPYNELPTWLNEGLAMYAEGALEPTYAGLLKKAVTEDSLISVQSLSSPFSAYAKEAVLSYAQSYSLVEYLVNTYGRDKMLELLATFRQGSSYDDALMKVYGFDTDGLDRLWREYVSQKFRAGLAPRMLVSAGF